MTTATQRSLTTSVNQGNSEVNFHLNDENQLNVTIDTGNLHIRSVEASEKDISSYAALFGDKDVMCKYVTGQTQSREQIGSRIKNVWAKRWNENDPYAGLAVFKNDTDEFLGHVVLGHGDEPGQSELAYLFMKNYWNKGFGTEAVTAVVKDYAPATIEKGYLLEGKSLEKIVATTRTDNFASKRILEKIGMHKIGEEEKHEAMRHHFSIGLSELINKPTAP